MILTTLEFQTNTSHVLISVITMITTSAAAKFRSRPKICENAWSFPTGTRFFLTKSVAPIVQALCIE
ncbi:hypothetical protein PDIG_29600 [Penicillium digitatum PHI26]|uniref:Uncharacterized protein n=2 Tax=Penicillium digitatum TaxID=36651 RepID=K9GP43_PEND2|nr:hypothetical protein PDIP_64000 [Penicillium digitatum Pd1]EKV09602.1 hypothetical protein PDIP_64000 [Penicillium digitatum Pd1]EKV14881.1 hypothetical protein PDIG_29600 [Penicillium digitatum PHI26]